MRTTTVVWAPGGTFDPDTAQAKKQRMEDFAAELAGDLFRYELETTYNEDKSSFTVRRSWPDLAAAQGWVDYVLTEGATEAQVDPE